GSDNVIRVWDTDTRRETGHLIGHTGSVATLAWAPAAKLLISAGFDTTVRLWRLSPTQKEDRISAAGPLAHEAWKVLRK
ncbi:unnamed protein product, partial [marine sediment metagenome]